VSIETGSACKAFPGTPSVVCSLGFTWSVTAPLGFSINGGDDLEIEFCWNFVSPSILCSKKKKDPGSTLGVTLHGLIQGEIDLSRNYIQAFEASRNL